MNPGLSDAHPSIRYYDSDYPSRDGPLSASNFDAMVATQGLEHDTTRFLALLGPAPQRVVDLCTGSGRIGIPLARAGHEVVGVDISPAMIAQFERRLAIEPIEVRRRVTLVTQDVSALQLGGGPFDHAVIGFNSLLCIPEFALQQLTLYRAFDHLKPGGQLIIDAVNPLTLNISGDAQPKPFFTRVAENGRRYTRFAMMGPFDAEQRQELSGWYDEYAEDGTVHREFYSVWWRPIFRHELELMLGAAGFIVTSVEGGHQGEPFTAQSRKLFVVARKP